MGGPRPCIWEVLGQYIRRPGPYNGGQNQYIRANASFKTFRQKGAISWKKLKNGNLATFQYFWQILARFVLKHH